jgi:NAD(P)-dependent dehydrogenase (short-subunit alcohol dehydrogenase family)
MTDNPALSPPHVLIVGAGPGIGASFARLALERGAQVTLSARSASKLDQLKSALAADGDSVDTVVADAADPGALRDTINDYATECDVPIDCALFNVSLWVPGGLDSDLEGVTEGLKAGVVSALAMAQAVIPRMRELPSARILFTGGGTADSPMTASFGLGLQKSALRNLAFALDKDLADTSIRVRTLTIRGTIAPGTAFDPDLIAKALWTCADERGVEKEFTGAGN